MYGRGWLELSGLDLVAGKYLAGLLGLRLQTGGVNCRVHGAGSVFGIR